MDQQESPEFWENTFQQKKEMWGMEPAKSAELASEFFRKHQSKTILVPGFGYGRNAQLFARSGMQVTGIEISSTAIELARQHYGNTMDIHHGSVTEMPFDTKKYDGIFCYALIHLLDAHERSKLISDCYEQLNTGGYMIFVAISKKANTYGTGKQLSEDRYELFGGVNMYFYDLSSIQKEFGSFGLQQVTEVQEQYPFYLLICQKQ